MRSCFPTGQRSAASPGEPVSANHATRPRRADDGRFVAVGLRAGACPDAPGDSAGPMAAVRHGQRGCLARIIQRQRAPAGNEFWWAPIPTFAPARRWRRRGAGPSWCLGRKGPAGQHDGWDILGRTSPAPASAPVRCITRPVGDNFAALSWDGTDTWWCGPAWGGRLAGRCFRAVLQLHGSPDQGEFQVNTTWVKPQMQPTWPRTAMGGSGGLDQLRRRAYDFACCAALRQRLAAAAGVERAVILRGRSW